MKTILRATAVCLVFGGSALALTGERFPEIPLDKMTPQQRTVADAIMSGPRQRMSGPFNAWLRSPELADRLQKVGEYVRYKTSLDKRLNEMAIIMTAQYWGSQYEWFAHAPLAAKAGLDPDVIAALGAGKKPEKMKDDEAIVYDLLTEIYRDRKVSDATFSRAVGKFGEKGIMDIIGLASYYGNTAMALIVSNGTRPAGNEPKLQKLTQNFPK